MKTNRESWRSWALTLMIVLPTLVMASGQGQAQQSYAAQAGQRTFAETGKTIQGKFLDYWERNGDLSQQGFPISDEMQERSDTDGKIYTVQYFERAVFELHPENQPPYEVLLSQLGTFRYRETYLQPVTPTPVPPTVVPPTAMPPTAESTPTQVAGAIPQPPEYAAVRARFENMTPEQWKAAGYTSTNPCDPGIGVRIWNQELWGAQYNSRTPDPQNPPILFADYAGKKIIGLQWAAPGDIKPTPVLFGQPMFLVYPGGEARYALFSWFKPDGYVRFAQSDSAAKCRP